MVVSGSTLDVELLSKLLFAGFGTSSSLRNDFRDDTFAPLDDRLLDHLYQLDIAGLETIKSLADSNHVIVRTFNPLQHLLTDLGRSDLAKSVAQILRAEEDRIDKATEFLQTICTRLEEKRCPVIVIKSLDHWPDLGSDLDLYTSAHSRDVVEQMRSCFNAKPTERSWGDRLAGKWNFVVPGLAELVEIHVGRLGQMGEQTAVTLSLTSRSRTVQANRRFFRVAAPEDRIVISTLQRMYRHFYIRLCDVFDNAVLVKSGAVDFDYLRSLGQRAGLWDGIATYLAVIAEYTEAYSGQRLELPSFVTQSARIGVNEISFQRQFLRVPIVPHGVALYARELKILLARGDFRNSFRLSLMPGLATAAAVGMKITGSDKGIW